MKIKNILITLGLALLSFNVLAGLTQPAEVEVDLEIRFAQGDMKTARNSPNEFAFIGCGIRKIAISPTEIFSFGFCQANVGEVEDGGITCFTENPELLAAIDAISDYSYVTFSWDEAEECTRIGNSTQSFYLPRLKEKK